ncbi:hypothetical protein [Rhizobium rhizogenes]|uniref:hypothetical protein n=1 Tax=Rhizobium rhizogenes TaxID=359 RepID=UPI0013AEBE56|nr:hypothetical protein [Rhizobium rhizogenes]
MAPLSAASETTGIATLRSRIAETCLSMKRPSESVANDKTKRLIAIYDRISVQSMILPGRNIGMFGQAKNSLRAASMTLAFLKFASSTSSLSQPAKPTAPTASWSATVMDLE